MRAYEQGRLDDALLAALRDTRFDREAAPFELVQVRGTISRESFDPAAALDAQLERSFPTRFTGDPAVTLGAGIATDDMPRIAQAHSATEHARLEQLVVERLVRLGLHTRAIVRAVWPEKAGGP